MQDELTLKFSGDEVAKSFDLSVKQWTGMQYPAEGEPEQPDAGSGAIVWDAALHLLHYLHSVKHCRPAHAGGAILELGAGTGVLGLGAEKIASMFAAGGSAEPVKLVLTDEGPVLDLLKQNAALNRSSASVLPFRWSAVEPFLTELESTLSRSSSSSSSKPPSFVSTILASELIDTIPGPANEGKGGVQGMGELVSALVSIARHSLQAQTEHRVEKPSVEVYFTFEQRGELHLRDATSGRPAGLLQRHLLQPLRDGGFAVATVHAPPVYEADSDLVLLHLTMHGA
jgi:hypothetical protein